MDEGYTLASSPENALTKLSEKGFRKVLLTGGANINSAFAKAKLLDEIILNIEPVFIGKGVPLFAPQAFELNLQLISIDKSDKGITTLSYSVVK